MRILAIDPGTKLGWAISREASGTEDLAPRSNQGAGMRVLKMQAFLRRIKDAGLPELIVYEHVRRHQGTQAAHVYGALEGTLLAWAEENDIPCEAVPVGTIKKFATGKGNAGKPAMIEAAQQFYPGIEIVDDNHADALCLLHWATEEYES